MTKPIAVTCDLEVEAGYVRYRVLPPGEKVTKTERIGTGVVIDFDAAGDVLGIEVLGLDKATLAIAHGVAQARNLGFPVDLGQALAIS